MNLPACPQCHSTLTYPDGDLLICPECGHEWRSGEANETAEVVSVWRDAVGNELKDGDTVTLIKDLKLKGSSLVLKVGTKARNIRRVEGDHDIDCKLDGVGGDAVEVFGGQKGMSRRLSHAGLPPSVECVGTSPVLL